MERSAQLPFEIPIFSTLPIYATVGLAMKGHPTAFNQMLNQAPTLSCTRKFIKGFTTPQIGIPDIELHRYRFIDQYVVNFRYVKPYCIDIIRQMIDEGFYVYYTLVDDFYLPGKSWYGTRHMNHDGIICGYDDNDGTLSIAAYDSNWVFRIIRIPQKCFIEGLESAMSSKFYGKMTAFKMKENTVIELNEKEMLAPLREYLDSSFEKYPTDKEGTVRGVVVHDYMALYVEKLKDGSIPHERMDWRALRPIWEHKKCMLCRIKAVEAKNGWDNSLSERYTEVVDKADRIRMMYAMYQKNNNDKLLDKISKGLRKLSLAEKELVGEFVARLEKLLQ